MRKLLLFAALLLTSLQGKADWNTSLTTNTQITPTGVAYYDKELKTNQNGRTYILIVGPAENSLFYRLQVMDADGNKKLGRAGTVVSSEVNRTWTTWNEYLEVDNDGNAFVAVQDGRVSGTSTSLTYALYKYDQDGKSLWDTPVILNDSIGFPMGGGLQMQVTPDNGVLCAYEYTEDDARDIVVLEKLDATGKQQWKKTIFTGGRLSRPYPFLGDAGDGNVLVVWVDGSEMQANVVNATTGELQNETPTTVYTNGFVSSKVMDIIDMKPGPDNGLLFSIVDSNKQGRLVYVKKDATNGLDGSNAGVLVDQSGTGLASTGPAVSYSPETETFTCFYKVFDNDSSKYQSLYMQQLDKEGNMKWQGGKQYLDFQTDDQYSYFESSDAGDGKTAVFYLKYNNTTFYVTGEYIVIDKDGNLSKEATQFAASTGKKIGLWASEKQSNGKYLVAWEEKREQYDYTIFMQPVSDTESDGIASVESDQTDGSAVTEVYTLSGVKMDKPTSGINIVKLENGKTVKIVK